MIKRGQISIIIILGSVLLLSAVLVTLYEKGYFGGRIEDDPSTLAIKDYFTSCLEATAKEGASYIGEHGGFYNLNDARIRTEKPYSTSYYFFIGLKAMPFTGQVEDQLEMYIEDHISDCSMNLSVFQSQGFVLEVGEPEAKVSIAMDDMVVDLDMPVKIISEDRTRTIDMFEADVKTKLGRMLLVADDIINRQMLDPDYIQLSYIYNEASKNELYIDIQQDADSATYFYVVNDESKEPSNKLIFAAQYKEYSCLDPPPDADSDFYKQCADLVKGEMR